MKKATKKVSKKVSKKVVILKTEKTADTWDAVKDVFAEKVIKTDKCKIILKAGAVNGEYLVYMQVLEMDERFRAGPRFKEDDHERKIFSFRPNFRVISIGEPELLDDVVYLRGQAKLRDLSIVRSRNYFLTMKKAVEYMDLVEKALKEWSAKWEGWKEKKEAALSEIPKELKGDWYTEYPIGDSFSARIGARVLTHKNKVYFRVTESSGGFDVFLQVWSPVVYNEFIHCAIGFPTLAGAVNHVRKVALDIRSQGDEWFGLKQYGKPVEETKTVEKTTDVGDLMILVGKIKSARKKLDEAKERVKKATEEERIVFAEMDMLLKEYEKIGKDMSGNHIEFCGN